MLVHATAVARHTRHGWRAVLLRGASGAGKSDLALRLVADGWRLVGDDYVEAWASGGALHVAPAPRLAGLIEARGLGVTGAAWLASARAAVVVDCLDTAPERLPEPQTETFEGVALARHALVALEASAPAKVRLMLDRALA